MKGYDALSRISGLSKGTIRKIAIKVVENNKILNSCSIHSFDKEISKRKWKCSNCGGTVNSLAKSWYEKGLSHDSPAHRYPQKTY